jgi:hypothetical protein
MVEGLLSRIGTPSGIRVKHFARKATLQTEPESSFDRGGHRRERGPRVEADRVAGWIDDHSDGSDAVRQAEGEPVIVKTVHAGGPTAGVGEHAGIFQGLTCPLQAEGG